MTVAEAIALTRSILDEPSYEYFGSSSNVDGEVIDALRQAASLVASECWYRGEKEALLPEWVEETQAVDAQSAVTPLSPFLFIESVRSNFKGATAIFNHAYVAPTIFFRRQWRALGETGGANLGDVSRGQRFSSRLEYTVSGNRIVVNREVTVVENNQNITVSYIRVPTISPTLSNAMPLAEYMHAVICDTAAGLLYRKEHPGTERPDVGGIVDLEAAIISVIRGDVK
jgi:hypothetical protein